MDWIKIILGLIGFALGIWLLVRAAEGKPSIFKVIFDILNEDPKKPKNKN